MRDGIKLSTDIYLPPEDIEGPYPAILERTPYDNARDMARVFDLGSSLESIKSFVAKGYAYVFQDVRGKCDSEGRLGPPSSTRVWMATTRSNGLISSPGATGR